jgi:hypothetical protein
MEKSLGPRNGKFFRLSGGKGCDFDAIGGNRVGNYFLFMLITCVKFIVLDKYKKN